MSGLPQGRMRQAIMIAWPGRIMIRPAEPRMRGSDPRTAVYYANLSRFWCGSITLTAETADAIVLFVTASLPMPLVGDPVLLNADSPTWPRPWPRAV